jgi:transcriptional regulator with XRE-family HTH domain
MFKFDGAQLAAQRQQRGLTQRGLGVKIGLTHEAAQQTVSRWERKGAVPDANTLPLLAFALGCTIDSFYTAGPDEQGDTTAAGAA